MVGAIPVSLEGRDGEIWRLAVQGQTQEAIARRFGIGQQRVSQIIARVQASIGAPDREARRQRALELLDRLQDEMAELVAAPAPPAYDVKGNPLVDPRTGELVLDTAGRMAAIDRILKIQDRTARMLGLDAPAQVVVTPSEAAQARTAQAAIDALARMAEPDDVIEASVIPEPESDKGVQG